VRAAGAAGVAAVRRLTGGGGGGFAAAGATLNARDAVIHVRRHWTISAARHPGGSRRDATPRMRCVFRPGRVGGRRQWALRPAVTTASRP
jgi:hypothetical protein